MDLALIMMYILLAVRGNPNSDFGTCRNSLQPVSLVQLAIFYPHHVVVFDLGPESNPADFSKTSIPFHNVRINFSTE